MARWSGNGGWGDSERTITLRTLIASLVIVFIVGAMGGWWVRSHNTPTSKLQGKSFRDSLVIDPSTDAVLAADETPEGAVRAVTSFITGLPQVALSTPQAEQTTLDQIMDPRADQSVRLDIQNAIDTGRNELVGTGSFSKPLTTKLLFSPASYRVDMFGKDRARVQVWMVLIQVDGAQQTALANWSTNDITVTWSDHWRISSYDATLGPTPTIQSPNGEVSSYTDVVNRINGFVGYRYAIGTPKQ